MRQSYPRALITCRQVFVLAPQNFMAWGESGNLLLWLQLDGSFGEGGGQILRTALSLSCLTGTPFCVSNIRRERRKPGLMSQQLAAVRAARSITQATLQGADMGSTGICFTLKGEKTQSFVNCRRWHEYPKTGTGQDRYERDHARPGRRRNTSKPRL
jgi:hypothetical protein